MPGISLESPKASYWLSVLNHPTKETHRGRLFNLSYLCYLLESFKFEVSILQFCQTLIFYVVIRVIPSWNISRNLDLVFRKWRWRNWSQMCDVMFLSKHGTFQVLGDAARVQSMRMGCVIPKSYSGAGPRYMTRCSQTIPGSFVPNWSLTILFWSLFQPQATPFSFLGCQPHPGVDNPKL